MKKINNKIKDMKHFVAKKKLADVSLKKMINRELEASDKEIFDEDGNLILYSGQDREKPAHDNYVFDATGDTIVDFPLTETYGEDFNTDRRENKYLRT